MTTYDPEDQDERRRVLRNDERVRNQSRDTGTYLSHTHSEVGGRFAVTEHSTITGVVSPAPPPLPANSPWASADPVPDEPPLGYRIHDLTPHELEPSIASVSPAVGEAQATDDPADAPSSGSGPATPSGGLVSEPAGSSPSSKDEG
jgi:hypothetical protein